MPGEHPWIFLNCVCSDLPLENRIRLGKIGHAWCFPLSQKVYHIGCGSLVADPREIMESLGWIERASSPDRGNVRCRCNGAVRLTSPYYSLPFHHKDTSCEIWGVGEAIGCVAPLAGDGIVPGMKSAQILSS